MTRRKWRKPKLRELAGADLAVAAILISMSQWPGKRRAEKALREALTRAASR